MSYLVGNLDENGAVNHDFRTHRGGLNALGTLGLSIYNLAEYLPESSEEFDKDSEKFGDTFEASESSMYHQAMPVSHILKTRLMFPKKMIYLHDLVLGGCAKRMEIKRN